MHLNERETGRSLCCLRHFNTILIALYHLGVENHHPTKSPGRERVTESPPGTSTLHFDFLPPASSARCRLEESSVVWRVIGCTDARNPAALHCLVAFFSPKSSRNLSVAVRICRCGRREYALLGGVRDGKVDAHSPY